MVFGCFANKTTQFPAAALGLHDLSGVEERRATFGFTPQ